MGLVSEFKEFIAKGNVLDLAVGVIIGASFGKIVTSLTDDILMPIIGLALGKVDFANLFVAMNGQHYATIEEAKKAGVGTINYGLFINALINFLIIAFIIFLIVKAANRMKKAPIEVVAVPAPPTTEQQLLMDIRDSLRASRL
ncbi:mechanosensitive ion channel protein MscL [Hymenobacter sedentarius]|uniref:Large-conductance mechanosensitive channel n=1 Tax=Hymenobacter sedentarius TaxID=1411621 RepID=A0A0U4CMP3_9BACT|nr:MULTISPECIES: large conductance mechanosensitive channel protein MscL [Hymenobacter]ALW84542.1 mechanosensitive ion channel protein MscL [Hymenobacter sedentarius]MCC3154018.1 large conductance mechanosensitive channel protein MscL [Hymenobacter sp. BT770]MDO3416162.1 large conductance mechanosensitive channel protein MscL [Hymenobacter sp. BT770]